jgi:hypothetical protein
MTDAHQGEDMRTHQRFATHEHDDPGGVLGEMDRRHAQHMSAYAARRDPDPVFSRPLRTGRNRGAPGRGRREGASPWTTRVFIVASSGRLPATSHRGRAAGRRLTRASPGRFSGVFPPDLAVSRGGTA